MVSDTGKIKDASGTIIKSWIINSGYEQTYLSGYIETKGSLVHRLVAKEFCQGFQEGLTVNHIDGNRLNNNASNLEWVTHKENMADVKARGKLDTVTARAHNKLTRSIDKLTMDGEYICTYSSLQEAGKAIDMKSYSHITNVAKGQRNSCGGYKWRYTDHTETEKFSQRLVTQLGTDGGILQTFSSIREAERVTGFTNLTYHFKTKEQPFQYKGYYWNLG